MKKHIIAAVAAMAAATPAMAVDGPVKLEFEPARANVTAGAGQAVVVAVFSNMAPGGGDNDVYWLPYDRAGHRLAVPEKGDSRPYGFHAVYATSIFASKKAEYTAYVGVVPAGDYVLAHHDADKLFSNSFCFGAPVFHVEPGTVSYIGGYKTWHMVPTVGLRDDLALAWEANIDRAKAALALFPGLADKLVVARIENGATFDCAGNGMFAYRVPGAPDIGDGTSR
jgi:hypothetical protein